MIPNDHDMDAMTREYLVAAVWTAVNMDGERIPVGPAYGTFDIDDADIARAVPLDVIYDAARSCDAFIARSGLSAAAVAAYDPEAMGLNLFLSRNGHGAGFFDAGTAEGDELQEAARRMGSTEYCLWWEGDYYYA